MNFEAFARLHGILVSGPIVPGKWMRFPTEDHPRTKNGAVKFMGNVGWVQNHATQTEPATWFPDSTDPCQPIARRDAMESIRLDQRKAAGKAAWIIKQGSNSKHPYLEAKGFPDATGIVWERDGSRLLTIPMRIGRDLVGVQLIDSHGRKKFLSGQRCSGAEYLIDAKGVDIWCEGYATGLSIRHCLHHLKMRYRIHITFSAGNLRKMATSGIVVADNDASGTGVEAARATKLRYWVSDVVGEDFNDFWRRVGTFRAGQELSRAMRSG